MSCWLSLFQIVFRNLASRPYNIYPHGLTSIRPYHAMKSSQGKAAGRPWVFRMLGGQCHFPGPGELPAACGKFSCPTHLSEHLRPMAPVDDSWFMSPLVPCHSGSKEGSGDGWKKGVCQPRSWAGFGSPWRPPLSGMAAVSSTYHSHPW